MHEFFILQGQLLHLNGSKLPFQVDIVELFMRVHQFLEFFPINSLSHGPGLEEPSIVIPGKVALTGVLNIFFD